MIFLGSGRGEEKKEFVKNENVSDEVFKVQSNNLPVLAEEVSFEGAEEKESASGIIEFLEETFGLTLSN